MALSHIWRIHIMDNVEQQSQIQTIDIGGQRAAMTPLHSFPAEADRNAHTRPGPLG